MPSNLTSLRNRPRRTGDNRPSLVDRKRPFFTGVDRFGIAKWSTYLGDPFHTLLNLPWWKFIIIFFATYVIQFITFALIYLAFPNSCTIGINGSFAHALWLSSRTASTIGFNQIYPDVTCVGPNVIVANLINFIMLGLVFARFSAPFKRATSIAFSKYLEVEAHDMQQMNLQLGFPAHITHIIKPGSPLYNLSLQFVDLHLEMRGGKLGLDFALFDATTCSTVACGDEHLTFKRLTEQATGQRQSAGAAAGAAGGATGSGLSGPSGRRVSEAGNLRDQQQSMGSGVVSSGFGGQVELQDMPL
eukprot:gene9467-9632_t